MLFNSIEFLIFLAVFFAAWPLMRRDNNRRWTYLIACSFFFYGWWDWRFLFLLAGTGLNDYFAGLAMVRWPRAKKIFLGASIAGNLGSLLIFKYLDFSITNLNWLMGVLHLGTSIPLAHLILPVGISFYTFQSLSYTIDVYKGRLQPTRNLLHFFAFLSLFPQLLAGPIVRATDLLPQLKVWNKPTDAQRWDGLRLIFYGYFKKAVLADNLAPIVSAAFGGAFIDSGLYWWTVIVCFAFQIYCDFSGYSDIARGLAKWMGYEFVVNFEHPYISASIREFWTRWHISLSTWYRDYVYIGLGGARTSAARAHLNMWITMLSSGIWHGAAWTFIIWSALHALYLSLERITRWPQRLCALPGGRHAATLIVFVLVCIAWVFFRANSFDQAFSILGAMFHPAEWFSPEARNLLLKRAPWLLSAIFLRQLYFHLRLEKKPVPLGVWARWAEVATLVAVVWCCIFVRGPGSAFVYFQF
jgi:D-alanyl-lipoteichoic acid acyltransferase DltB (MBOAT superfamily)